MDGIQFKQPELYSNRELGLLAFHHRVLDLAMDDAVPLLERLRFLCISSTNLDEFFEIRVAGIKEQIAFGSAQPGPDNLSPRETLAQIRRAAHELVEDQYRILNDVLIPALAAQNIRFVRRTQWNDRQAEWVLRYFNSDLLPVLSPLGLDPAHPFPRVLNKSLNFIISLEGRDAFGRAGSVAVVQAPRSLPRLIPLPLEYAQGPHDFVLLSSIIHAQVNTLFPGMKVTGCYQFRATRNSDLFVDEEEIDDLLRAVQGELLTRHYGDAVRLEVADNCPADMADFLLQQFNLDQDDLYRVNGLVNLNRLLAIYDLPDRGDLRYPAFSPAPLSQGAHATDLFERIRARDIVLHHPYQSFAPVLEFVRQAAADPSVLAIKQTLYRTGTDSDFVRALIDAALAGKEVTVVIELRARFDEEANIALASKLQEAGAHVVYGVVGYKTHAKMILVVRREGRRLRRYTHLGTGNYHVRTASQYTDIGLLTADQAFGEDVHKLFQQLTGLGRVTRLKRILQSPFTLHRNLLAKIARATDCARQGRPARIIAKMNALVEPQIIAALYEAASAGVRIDLIVRGICCLRPGVPGVSESITVRSIVGRFLEHSRVYCFEYGDEQELYCSSADWMERNFFRRVEVAFPIEDADARTRLRASLLQYLNDNTEAWRLHPDGSYHRIKVAASERPRSAQNGLLRTLAQTPPA